MNSVEFTKFMNELRMEYGLPPKLPKKVVSRSSERSPVVMSEEPELEDFDLLTEEDCTSLQQPEDTLT